MLYQAEDYSRLEREIASSGSQELLEELKEEWPSLSQYVSWADVVAETQGRNPDESRRDGILRPLLARYEETGDRRVPTILMVMFWRRLRTLCRRKKHWAPDWELEEVRWANVLVAFHWSISKYRVDRRPEGIESKLLGDTLHRLYEEYERDWDFLGQHLLEDMRPVPETTPEAEEDDDPPRERGEEDLEIEAFELLDELEDHAGEYQRDLEAGVITEFEYCMLVSTRVYGEQLTDYAADHALKYDTIKRQRLRAEARRRRAREK